MDIVWRLAAALARAVGWDVGHRTWAVERHQRDDVLEAVGAHVDQRPPHALPFHLEHADRFAPRQEFVARLVVEWNAREVDINAARTHVLDRGRKHGERFQTKEVKLHKAGLLDPFHIELGHRHVGLWIAVERHKLGQRPVADDDAGGVGRGMPVQAFELLRNRERTRHHRLAVAERLQPRLVRNGARQRDRLRRIVGDEFAQLVDLPVWHFQHAADIAQHTASLQRTERDDLRDLLAAVLSLHITNDVVAMILAEVDVEIGHRHALGIEEAFEQKSEAQRVEIRDQERIGDQRARPGAAPRPHRNAFILRPLDEVGDDQEIARIAHALDNAELESEALAVVFLGAARRYPVRGDPALKPIFGQLPQQSRLVGRGCAVRGKARQDRRACLGSKGRALGNLDARGQCLRQVGKKRCHFGTRFEPVLRRQLAAIRVRDRTAFGDADQGIVRFVVIDRAKVWLVGRNERDIPRIGKVEQMRFDRALCRKSVALQLDVQPITEELQQGRAASFSQVELPGSDGLVEGSRWAAGERNQARARLCERGQRDMRRIVCGRFQECARREPHDVAIAVFIGRQQHQSRQRARMPGSAAVLLVGKVDRQRATNDRLDAGTGHLVGELKRAKHVVGVGERERRLSVGLRKLGKARNRQRAFQQRIGRMNVQMHKLRVCRHGYTSPERSGQGDSSGTRWCGRGYRLSTRNHRPAWRTHNFAHAGRCKASSGHTTRRGDAEMDQSAARTWAHTTTMPRNKVMDASVAASSTTARNMTRPQDTTEHRENIVRLLFLSQAALRFTHRRWAGPNQG